MIPVPRVCAVVHKVYRCKKCLKYVLSDVENEQSTCNCYQLLSHDFCPFTMAIANSRYINKELFAYCMLKPSSAQVMERSEGKG